MDTDAAASARFLNSIGVKFVPKPAPKTEPPAKPQAPIEPKPVKPDKNNFSQRMSDEMDAQVEFERHPDLFNDTPGGWENVELVLDYVKENHDGYLSRQTVHDAVTTLQRRGELLTLFKPEPFIVAKDTTGSVPRNQEVKQPVVVQRAPPVTTPKPVDDLPELSPWVWKQLGSNKLLTRRDVYAVPTALYSSLLKGPHAEAFRNRVNAALAR